MTNTELPAGDQPLADDEHSEIAPINADELLAFGAAEPNTSDEPLPIYVGPDDDPPLGPLTLKEAYGEALGAALAWSDDAQLVAVHSSTSADDAFVDRQGTCPAWTFTFVNSTGATYDLDVVNGQAVPSPYASEEVATPFALEDLADSPELIARSGLGGNQFIVRLGRSSSGALTASIQSLEPLAQTNVDPSLHG